MPDRELQDVSVTEAEWHLAASEYRVYLAMRQRAQGDTDVGHEGLSRLFDDLVEAIALHRAAVSAEIRDEPVMIHPSPLCGATFPGSGKDKCPSPER